MIEEAKSTEEAQAATEDQTTTGAPGEAQESKHTGQPTWELVEELRAENARRRVQSKQYEDAFSGYQPDEQTALLDIAKQLADPSLQPAAAKRLQAIAEEILKGEDSGPRRPTGEVDPLEKPLTRREWEDLERQKDQRRTEKDNMDAIYRDAEKLGYSDPDSPESALLFRFALRDTDGDLKAAHERVLAYNEAIVSRHAEQVAEGRNKWLTNPTGGASTIPGTATPPKTMKEASQAFREMLRQGR